MSGTTGARLARAFLGYLLGVVVIVTLVPFDFGIPRVFHLSWALDPADAIANVAMFVPLGFLAQLTLPVEDPLARRPLLLGLALSAVVEGAQLFLPSRFPSPVDVCTNGLGAWLGGLVAGALRRRIQVTPALIGALALELPLMGLVYLLVPLLWVSGLAASGEPLRLLPAGLLGLAGAQVLGAVYRHRLGPAGALPLGRVALGAGAWFMVGAVAGLATAPLAVLAASVVVAGATWLSGSERRPANAMERRFEAETLRRVAPALALYLLLQVSWPPWAALRSWHVQLGFGHAWGATGTREILRTLEHLAAFTVLGYAVAEARGRREGPFRTSLGALAGTGLAAAAGLELLAAVSQGPGGSALRAVLAAGTAVYGGGIYHLQRAHVRWLLARGRSVPAEPHVPQRQRRQDEEREQGRGHEAPEDHDRHGTLDLPAGVAAAEREG